MPAFDWCILWNAWMIGIAWESTFLVPIGEENGALITQDESSIPGMLQKSPFKLLYCKRQFFFAFLFLRARLEFPAFEILDRSKYEGQFNGSAVIRHNGEISQNDQAPGSR